MSDIQDAAELLFSDYLDAWNARDFERIASCYAEPSVFVLPQQTVSLPDRAAMVQLLKRIFEDLEAHGFSHSTVGEIEASACGDGLAILDVRDVKRIREDGSILENIDAHYVIKQINGSWRFVVAVVCRSGWRSV